MKRTESVLVGLVCAVLALLFAYLCVYGSIFTSTIAEKHYTVETIVQVQDQPLFSLLGLLVACGILWLFSKVEGKIPLRAMVIFSLVWAALLGTLWVLAVRTEPRADAAEIVDAARQAMSRNYTELKRKDGYMNRHPYQLGFMAFSQLLQTIFGPKNYLALQLVNVAFLTLAYGGTLWLLWLMTKKARTVRYGALLLLLCLQPILYVTFLYGNMASIACTLWAMCCLCRLARDGGAWRLIPAGLLCGLSVMMKPNGWIPVIAMLIVTGLWFLSEKKWKLLPLLFYFLIFEPEPKELPSAAIAIAVGFATFENVCYLIQNGADRFSFIFFRGFGTGAMHVLCGLIVGGGLAYAWQRTWLKLAGTCGLLGAAITLHAIYNLLIAYGGAAQYIAYALPVLLVAAGRWSAFRLSQRK